MADANRCAGVRLFGAPSRYVQGSGLLERCGEYIREFAQRLLVVCDRTVFEIYGERIEASLYSNNLMYLMVLVDGAPRRSYLDSLIDQLGSVAEVNGVVGVGGGQALDIAKGICSELSIPTFVSIPTAASNDGPTSKVAAFYDDGGVLNELIQLPVNPSLVLVDSKTIATAPAHLLIAGVGDAMSKAMEAAECAASSDGVTTQGSRPLQIGAIVANGCFEVLRKWAPSALSTQFVADRDTALEHVIEAVILLSGIGYENGGLSVAHCMTRGFMANVNSRRTLHGYQVAYGVLVQSVLAGYRDWNTCDLIGFNNSVGLPTKLSELGVDANCRSNVVDLAEATVAAPHILNFHRTISVSDVVEAVYEVESLSFA